MQLRSHFISKSSFAACMKDPKSGLQKAGGCSTPAQQLAHFHPGDFTAATARHESWDLCEVTLNQQSTRSPLPSPHARYQGSGSRSGHTPQPRHRLLPPPRLRRHFARRLSLAFKSAARAGPSSPSYEQALRSGTAAWPAAPRAGHAAGSKTVRGTGRDAR